MTLLKIGKFIYYYIHKIKLCIKIIIKRYKNIYNKITIMENNIGEKNTKLSKELANPDELSIKIKIFNFYFYVLRKKDINMFLCGFLLILETFQLVSYAFTTPHMNNWGVKTNTMDYIQLIVEARG